MTRFWLTAGALAIVFAAPLSIATAALVPLDDATLGRVEPAQYARTPGLVRVAIKEVDKTKKKKVLTTPGQIKGFDPQPDPPARQQRGSAPQH